MTDEDYRQQIVAPHGAVPRSLPLNEWPAADRKAWEEAFRPGLRLRKGGAASRYAEVSREDFVRRYGAFLGFLQRSGLLDPSAGPAAQVTPRNVELYIAELKARVRSVTVWNCIYKLRMAARVLDQNTEFAWLSEIEQDLALVMEPRSKFDRVVLAERLVEAGLTLVTEAEAFARYPFKRAIGIRNGLLIALLAECPIRIKNYAALEIGTTFKEERGTWWVTLPYGSTKTEDSDQRPVPACLHKAVKLYLAESRPALIGSRPATNSLWIASRTGRRYTTKNLGTRISKITLETIGIDVSPHLFRTAAATTAACHGTDMPYLASALLGHTDPRVTEEHYIRATTLNAAKDYAAILRRRRSLGRPEAGGRIVLTIQ
jgi:integrase